MPHLTCLGDLGRGDLLRLLDAADRFRDGRGELSAEPPLTGKCVALVFEKASTRTRISLEVAVVELGGYPLVMTHSGSQLGRGESLADTARVLSRMVHAVAFRTSKDASLDEFVRHSSVPVLNALTDSSHPMQLLADLQTVRRAKGKLQGLRFAWIGDGNNMANSWMEAAGLLELELVLACPNGYDPDPRVLATAVERGAKIRIVREAKEAARNADVISTDVFTSMGQEAETEARKLAFAGMCVTREVVAVASPEVIVLHCLPAHRGEEIEAEVLDGPRSLVWDQAEARLHTGKAAILWALEKTL